MVSKQISLRLLRLTPDFQTTYTYQFPNTQSNGTQKWNSPWLNHQHRHPSGSISAYMTASLFPLVAATYNNLNPTDILINWRKFYVATFWLHLLLTNKPRHSSLNDVIVGEFDNSNIRLNFLILIICPWRFSKVCSKDFNIISHLLFFMLISPTTTSGNVGHTCFQLFNNKLVQATSSKERNDKMWCNNGFKSADILSTS